MCRALCPCPLPPAAALLSLGPNPCPARPVADLNPAGPARDRTCPVLPPRGSRASASRVRFSPKSCLSFRRWAFGLTSRLAAAKTAFSAFFLKTLHLSWRGPAAPADVLLPLPVPCPGAFQPLGHAGQERRQRTACQIALHAVVVAINFVYADCAFVPLRLLARPPNEGQARCLAYLRSLVRTFGEVEEDKLPSETGRRMNSLIARLGELSGRLTLLGSLGDPYSPVPAGAEVGPSNDTSDLQPYRSLDASRIVLKGRANWDPTDFLPPELAMAFVLPSSLLVDRVPDPSEYPRSDWESPSETFALAQKWDDCGLLLLEPSLHLPVHRFTRIFNCWKNKDADRQIGDRRGMNAIEGKLQGPSKWLPTGEALCALTADAGREALVLSLSDRRDFYHQLAAPWSRTTTNRLFPSFPVEDFRGTAAYERLSARFEAGCARKPFGGAPPLTFWPQLVQPCFQAVLQGDHLGVEIATAAHERLLLGAGLLKPANRLLGSHPVGPGPCWDALVIDDYFCVARVPKSLLSCLEGKRSTPSSLALASATAAYQEHGILGSPEKDLQDVVHGTAAGAEINSSSGALGRGHILVSAPASKRLAISDIGLEVASMPATTDCLHVCLLGAFTSAANFRRPVSACFHQAYQLVPSASIDAASPKVVRLPRRIAQELQLAALFAPIAVTDVSAGFLPRLFAADSSENKGAFVSAAIPQELSRSLWLTSDRKGAYAKLATRTAAILHRHDPLHEEPSFEPHEEADVAEARPARPLAYLFDFLEIGIGPPALSVELSRLGFRSGPFLDLRLAAPESSHRLVWLEWVLYLFDLGRVDGLRLSPPCSAYLPSCGNGAEQVAFNLAAQPVFAHEASAFKACVVILRHARRRGVACFLDQPASSLFRFSPEWVAASAKEGIVEGALSSCAFGDRFRRDLVFLSTGLQTESLSRGCQCVRKHLTPSSGSSRKGFRLTPGLITVLGRVFSKGLSSRRAAISCSDISIAGLERIAVNDLAQSLPWETDCSWRWPREVHINIREASVLCRLYKRLALEYGRCRFVNLCDSFVALSALGKGRSSSDSLRHAARRSSMTCLAAGLYPGNLYTPTRFMPADHPTRDQEFPPRVDGFGLDFWTSDAIFADATRPRLKRWASSWARLTLLLLPRSSVSASPQESLLDGHLDFRAFVRARLFDGTLGFPGEGPLSCFGLAGPRLLFLVSVWSVFLRRFFLCLGFLPCLGAAAMENTRTALLQNERAARRSGILLRPGRPVLSTTQLRRDKLKDAFQGWLLSLDVSLEWFLVRSKADPDFANEVLISYGQYLFREGKSYSAYSETLNMFTSLCPSLRRLLQPSWDLAFAWQREEPPVHHTAMPWQVIIALLAISLTYGWVDVAGAMALCWGGLARVGEVLEARRADLVLPNDTGGDVAYALLSVHEPKTRFRGARHQALRVDQPQLLRTIVLAFASVPAGNKLWAFSGSTLRNRFKKLLAAAGLRPGICPGVRDFDMGSLRAGGATWLMNCTENPDYVRRRGRWITTKVMEIYVQEVSSILLLPRLPGDVKQSVFDWASVFEAVLSKAEMWHSFGIPASCWLFLAAHGV